MSQDHEPQSATGKRPISRRTFVKGAGAVSVLIVGGGLWRAHDRGVFSTGSGPAYEPWTSWSLAETPTPLDLVHAAVLAANPHNSQPWLFRIADRRIDLFADRRRNIGSIDPLLREMYMGTGCALENIVVAAQAGGYAAQVTLLPDPGDAMHVATVDLTRSPAVEAAGHRSNAYHAAIPARHTNRGLYDAERPVPEALLRELTAVGADMPDVAVTWFTSPGERRRVGELIVAATQAVISDSDQSRDSAKWLRWTWDEVQYYRDGLTIDALGLPAAARALVKLLPRPSLEEADEQWLKATREVHVATAPAFGLLLARERGDTRQRIEAGRFWQRMQLHATTEGLAMHPLSQPVERADREASLGEAPEFSRALAELVGDPDWQAIMPFRVGYSALEALPSPRRAVEDVLIWPRT